MKTLAIDQSGPLASLSLLEDNQELGKRSWAPERLSHHLLYDHIRDLFNEKAFGVEDLDLVAVGTGPGGFTSLRIAAAAIGGLTLPGGPALQGVSSGEALAYGLMKSKGVKSVTVVGDARRNRFWVGRISMQGDDVEVIRDWAVVDADKTPMELAQADYVASPDWSRISDFLTEHTPAEKLMTEPAHIDATELGLLAQVRVAAGKINTDVSPIYLHPPVFVEPKFPVPED